jgi:hypothetical protein
MANRSQKLIYIYVVLAATLVVLIKLACADSEIRSDAKKEVVSVPEVKEWILKFRQGEEFWGSADEFFVNGQPDQNVLVQLAEALRSEPDSVREQVCKMLVTIGRQADPLFNKGGDMIRDRQIISILVRDGLRHKDAARDFCYDNLQLAVPPVVLKEYGQPIASDLRRWPDATALLVVARGKIKEALPVVDSLMEVPGWAKERETQIAKAALGDTEIENKFIEEFRQITDPPAKAELAKELGYIGTEKTLSALADDMRSDIIWDRPGVMMQSIRVFIVGAFHYNYPENPLFFDIAVQSDEDYASIEKFCEETFGTKWTKDRPEFLWIEGYEFEDED